jgi:hypothetical protein
MSMYLPNPDLYPTGSEPGEFIDVPAMADGAAGDARASDDNHEGIPTTGVGDSGPPFRR